MGRLALKRGHRKRFVGRSIEKNNRRMGPSEIDLFGFTKEASGIPEDLHWVAKRTLMKPPTKRIREVLNYIEMVVDKTEQKYPPSLWENCTVLITPTWASALS